MIKSTKKQPKGPDVFSCQEREPEPFDFFQEEYIYRLSSVTLGKMVCVRYNIFVEQKNLMELQPVEDWEENEERCVVTVSFKSIEGKKIFVDSTLGEFYEKDAFFHKLADRGFLYNPKFKNDLWDEMLAQIFIHDVSLRVYGNKE